MYYHNLKKYAYKNVYLNDNRNFLINKIVNLIVIYIVQSNEDDSCSFFYIFFSFFRMNSNQLFRYLVFDKITNLNFIDLTTLLRTF